MATRKAVQACLTLLSGSLNLDVSDTTVDAWELILEEAYDEDLPTACILVLRRWETTFLPPPGVILQECRRHCHRRMKELDENRYEERRIREFDEKKRLDS